MLLSVLLWWLITISIIIIIMSSSSSSTYMHVTISYLYDWWFVLFRPPRAAMAAQLLAKAEESGVHKGGI